MCKPFGFARVCFSFRTNESCRFGRTCRTHWAPIEDEPWCGSNRPVRTRSCRPPHLGVLPPEARKESKAALVHQCPQAEGNGAAAGMPGENRWRPGKGRGFDEVRGRCARCVRIPPGRKRPQAQVRLLGEKPVREPRAT